MSGSPRGNGHTGNADHRHPSASGRAGRHATAGPSAPLAASGPVGRSHRTGGAPCPVRPTSIVRLGPAAPEGPARGGGTVGLTGRGGARFPTARKLAAVAAGHAPVVVANGTEGEPASAKDKVLLARSPHLVLDGAVLAAEIVGAREAVVVVHHSVREAVDDAAAERREPDPTGSGSGSLRAPTGSSAGKPAPSSTGSSVASPLPPGGRRGSPNGDSVEGRHSCRTSRPWHTSRSSPVMAHRGSVRSARRRNQGRCWSPSSGQSTSRASTRLRSAHPSRRCSAWPAEHPRRHRPCCSAATSAAGSARLPRRPGLSHRQAWPPRPARRPIAVLPADACGLVETARVVRYLADESAGQCGPCLYGLDAIAGEMQRVAEGRTSDLSTLRRWLGQVDGRGACHHPDGVIRLIRSALDLFGPELEQHAQGWCCATRTASVCLSPRGDSDECRHEAAGRPIACDGRKLSPRSFPS